MEYNLASLRQRVLIDKLDDEDYESDVVDRFLNDSQRYIFNTYELPFQEKVFSGSLPINGTRFSFPEDVQSVQSMVVTSPDNMQTDITNRFINFRDFNRLYPTPDNNEPGPISAWTSFAGKMITSNPLDEPYILDTFYLKKPAILKDDADIPDVPEEFAELLILGAFKRALERNEDYDYAAVIGTQMDAEALKLVDRYGFRTANATTQMKMGRAVRRGL